MSLTNGVRFAHWKHHIDQWQSSGLSGTDYCRQHELTYHCFIYWRRKFSKATAKHSNVVRPGTDVQPASAFVKVPPHSVSQLAEVTPADSLHLCLPNGLEIRNVYASNVGHVRSLLACLS